MKSFNVVEELTVKETWIHFVEARSKKEALKRVEQYDWDDLDLDSAETVKSKIVEVEEVRE